MVLKAINGSLNTNDFIFPAVGGGFARSDEYEFSVTIGNTATQIDLVSSTPGYDPYLEIIDTRNNQVIFSDDDGGGFPNSRLSVNTLQVGIPYKLRVSSFLALDNPIIENNYSLTVNTAQGDFQLEPRLSSFINPRSGTNINFQAVLDGKDYTFPAPATGVPSLADEYKFEISTPNQPITIALNGLSSSYDPYLEVINARTGDVIAFDDDTGGGLDSLITGFTAQPGIDYRIRVTSFNAITPENPSQYVLEVNGNGVNLALAERGKVAPLDDPVYRFYNPVSRGHFFTINPNERDTVLANPQWGYKFEGVGFDASNTAGDSLLPVYRFYNPVSQGHFFTINPNERDTVLAHPEWGYTFEGVGFEAGLA